METTGKRKKKQENRRTNTERKRHRSTHHGGFPEAADASTVSVNNTNGGIDFDSTRGTFDWTVVHEYMTNTGSRGGALVTSFNISSRSDLRLYASDGNATLGLLHDKGPDGFLDVCVDRLGRMIDTVGGEDIRWGGRGGGGVFEADGGQAG